MAGRPGGTVQKQESVLTTTTTNTTITNAKAEVRAGARAGAGVGAFCLAARLCFSALLG